MEIAGAVLVIGALVVAAASANNDQGNLGFMGPGEEVKRLPLDGGGDLKVTRHRDIERSTPMPEGLPRTATQEWRVLRFERCEKYLQGVTKVCVLPEAEKGQASKGVQLLPGDLSLPYTKSLVSVLLSTLTAVGAPVSEATSSSGRRPVGRKGMADKEADSDEVMRILCIGLGGGGSVPSFLAEALPRCHVDVTEPEASVLQAATEAMGFAQGPNLRVHVGDGAKFALQQADARGAEGGAYDAVVVDCFDAEGSTPASLEAPGGLLAEALSKGLLRKRGVLAVNFLPWTDLTPRFRTYRKALQESGAAAGVSFSVAAFEGNLVAVSTCGALSGVTAPALSDLVTKAARLVQLEVESSFSMTEPASRLLTIWDDK